MTPKITVIHEPDSQKPYLIIDKPAGLPSAPLNEDDKENTFSQAAELYPELLNVQGNGLMGYVEIPVLSVKLPIYHGTDEETLDRGVGHLLGSSLPVGGANTHCVLTGHSGLAGQKMFSCSHRMILKKRNVYDILYRSKIVRRLLG